MLQNEYLHDASQWKEGGFWKWCKQSLIQNLYNFARERRQSQRFLFHDDGWSSLLKKPHEKLIMKPESPWWFPTPRSPFPGTCGFHVNKMLNFRGGFHVRICTFFHQEKLTDSWFLRSDPRSGLKPLDFRCPPFFFSPLSTYLQKRSIHLFQRVANWKAFSATKQPEIFQKLPLFSPLFEG